MKTTLELENLFFEDLKRYNGSNFKTLETTDVTKDDAKVRKCYSSVITRYFIFREKHEELTESELNLLYFKLKLDLIAQYFATYPDSDVGTLVAFQTELRQFVKNRAKQSLNVDIIESNQAEKSNTEVSDHGDTTT